MGCYSVFLSTLVLLLGTYSSEATSDIPVIFVHGFLGFGPDELFSFGYWAYKGEFEAEGYTTYEASVGPVSSNWDRACELFAQIKGTRVDYGAAHSTEFGHLQLGRDYTDEGFYPEWDEDHPIHLVGHSMGGQTIRMLEILLREGSSGQGSSELFAGNKKWIKSITTVSSPLDGTTLVEVLGDKFVDLIRDIIVLFAGFVDESFIEQIYDFDLDHWEVSRANGESADDYWDRLTETVLSPDNTDLAPFDLSTEGAPLQNALGQQAYSDTYYFAFATEDTYGLYQCFWFLRCGVVQYGELSMNILLQPFAASMGGIDEDEDCRKNDGVVNWNKQHCPTVGYDNPNKCQPYNNGNWIIGIWNWVDIPYLDHLGSVQQDWWRDTFSYSTSAKKLYRDHAQRLRELDVPSYTAAGASAAIGVSNAEAFLDPEDPASIAGAVVLISCAVAITLGAGFFMYKFRKARNQSGASIAKNVSSILPKVTKSSMGSFSRSPKKSSVVEDERAYSTPSPLFRLDTNRSYSQDVAPGPQV